MCGNNFLYGQFPYNYTPILNKLVGQKIYSSQFKMTVVFHKKKKNGSSKRHKVVFIVLCRLQIAAVSINVLFRKLC